MACIESRPPKRSPVHCFTCGAVCLPGKRRRDPYGNYYCQRHGCGVQRRIRRALDRDPELSYFAAKIPGFLRFVHPDVIGLGDEYKGVEFRYRSPPVAFPMHKSRPAGIAANCFRCGKSIPCGTSESRRGIDVHTVYCAVCGLAVRRVASRIVNSNRKLIAVYHKEPDVVKFLRNDIHAWLSRLTDEHSTIRRP